MLFKPLVDDIFFAVLARTVWKAIYRDFEFRRNTPSREGRQLTPEGKEELHFIFRLLLSLPTETL